MTNTLIESGATTDCAPSTCARSSVLADAARRGVPVIDVVVPVYNEQAVLSGSVHRLHRYLADTLPFPFRITIADNASTDATPDIAARLADEFDCVRVACLEQKGRGRALNAVWSSSDAPVLAYMDVDLSTDLAALAPLVAPLISGHSDLAIGTRLARTSRVVRGPKREVISRCYNMILKTTMSAKFSDAQCGFKAIRADVAQRLLPLITDTGWFFDTELLVLAERSGLRIHEVPVDWVDDPDSRVDIVATASADLKGIARMRKDFALGRIPVDAVAAQLGNNRVAPSRGIAHQLALFGAIGVASTLAYLAIFSTLTATVGSQAANFLALLITAIANTAANRRFTFGIRGQAGRARHHGEGLLVFGIALAITSGSLASVHSLVNPTPHWLELGVLVTANLAATVLRFVLLRTWVFHPSR
ncbi:bifunctional glycosyltransferase family 2/GtrA family protein [Mycolicibacterium stellerae]|uniref:bifunctional glycosyltransferase family 2/GtrA family protein n=1 Tax=Mycolicibacterium stellerae TaxID=2358193 RepID=UPI000F0B9A85|nr:bifunctional glycosyltransferase family 2/GtrA family protein [Mycolicibacterium stellerae]